MWVVNKLLYLIVLLTAALSAAAPAGFAVAWINDAACVWNCYIWRQRFAAWPGKQRWSIGSFAVTSGQSNRFFAGRNLSSLLPSIWGRWVTSAVYDVVHSYDTRNSAALLHQPFHYRRTRVVDICWCRGESQLPLWRQATSISETADARTNPDRLLTMGASHAFWMC